MGPASFLPMLMENTGNIYADILIHANANVTLNGKREIIYNNLCIYFNFRQCCLKWKKRNCLQ